MTSPRDVVIVGAARTAVGTFGGSLKDFSAYDLATIAVKVAIERSGIEAASARERAPRMRR